MTKILTIAAIAALTVLLAGVSAFTQNAEAIVAPNITSTIAAFEESFSFDYTIKDGEKAWKVNKYTTGCENSITVTGIYDAKNNKQSLAWVFPDEIDIMCGISQLSSYTDFSLVGVEYTIQSDGNTTIVESDLGSSGSKIHTGATSNSGTVYVTITASYETAI